MLKKFLFYLLVILAIGCKDDEDPVCTMTAMNIYQGTTLKNNYDVTFLNDRLSTVSGLVAIPGSTKETWFVYFDANRISQIFYEEDGSGFEDYYTYTYDNTVRNILFERKQGGSVIQTNETAELYLQENPADGIYYLDNKFVEMSGGNVARTGVYAVVNGENVINPAGQLTYTYDDRENILRDFFELPGLLELPFLEARINSKNNLLTITGGETETVTYKYDDKGPLTNYVDGETGTQLTFGYKCK
jgi:hypothetical protein